MNIHRVMKMKSLQTNHRPSQSFVIFRALSSHGPLPARATRLGRRLRDAPNVGTQPAIRINGVGARAAAAGGEES